MAKREDHRRLAIKPVKRDIATVTECDEPLAELGLHVFDRPPGARLIAQGVHAFADGFGRAAGRVRVLVGKE